MRALRSFAASFGLEKRSKQAKLILGGGLVALFLVFGMSQEAFADATQTEQVVVSPAEQAVINALANANTQVQQSVAATGNISSLVAEATAQAREALASSTTLSNTVASATTSVSAIDIARQSILNAPEGTIQSSPLVEIAQDSVIAAQTAVATIPSAITATATQLLEATTARSAVNAAVTTAATEFSQANAAIADAQGTINDLQATIATTREVLANVDDAGVQMILPFSMQMGGVNYSQVFVGSNATITFGTDEGWVYYDTPGAPSVSVGGLDWTTWSYGSGITYSTTASSLDIAWDLRVYPTTDSSIQMTQLRFNADVNPTTGAWVADVSGIGPNIDWARWNYRETPNGTITQIVDTNPTSGLIEGHIGQGNYVAPTTDPNAGNAAIQARIDAANQSIQDLNQIMSGVVATNVSNNQLVYSIPSTTPVTNAISAANTARTNLTSQITSKASALNTAIQSLPVALASSSPIINSIKVGDSTLVVNVALPEGEIPNTWFYQVTTDDETADNPYAGGTWNTDGAPSSFILRGLTNGVTYTINVANWNGVVSTYASQSSTPAAPIVVVPVPVAQPPVVDPVPEPEPEPLPEPVEPPAPEPEPSPEPSPDPDLEPVPAPEPPVTKPSVEEEVTAVVDDFLSDGKLSATDANNILGALTADGEISKEEVNSLSDALSADGTLTNAEKELVAEALIESVEPGEALTKDQIQDAGIEYEDLPPETPVEVRQDEKGNEVIITADVAAALVLLESPSELVGAIFSDPGQALQALGSIGADMSTEEREESTKAVVATVIAAGSAINAVAAAGAAAGGTTSSGGSSGGGSSGGGGASGDSKGVRRRKP